MRDINHNRIMPYRLSATPIELGGIWHIAFTYRNSDGRAFRNAMECLIPCKDEKQSRKTCDTFNNLEG